jgi:tRNA pseudouridine38-40 synthase
MMNIKATVEYNGKRFYGFQIQPDKPTVQSLIQDTLKKVFNTKTDIKYASRTDRGVHSKGQVISFKIPKRIPLSNIKRLLNDALDHKVIIKEVSECPADFNPRYHAKAKLYVYRIFNAPDADYLWKDFAWHIPYGLDWSSIRKAVKKIRGEHEFVLFSSESEHKTTLINMLDASLNKNKNMYEFKFKGPYFLTYMIRYLVGYLIAIRKVNTDIETFESMLDGTGSASSYCAPARGLELKRIFF